MVIYTEQGQIDISYLCTGAMGIFFLASYMGFAYFVTHRGDFYTRRRWKAAIWCAVISNALFATFLLFLEVKSLSDNLPENPPQIAVSLGQVLLFALVFLVPSIFVMTIGTHYQLTRWPSDDYLDKLWADPNKKNKNPIQPF